MGCRFGQCEHDRAVVKLSINTANFFQLFHIGDHLFIIPPARGRQVRITFVRSQRKLEVSRKTVMGDDPLAHISEITCFIKCTPKHYFNDVWV